MTGALFIGLAVWLALAVGLGAVMARRGHSGVMWALVAGALGPLAVPVAIAAVRREAGSAVVARGEGLAGSGGVVVGIDGSAGAEETLAFVVRTTAPALERLHLVTVVDFDVQAPGVAAAQQRLDDLAARYRHLEPTTAVLAGRPADQLASYAAECGTALVAVGARGSGNTPAFVGSVADRLTRVSTVPVLIGGIHREAQRPFLDVVDAAKALGGAGAVEDARLGPSEARGRVVRP